MLSKTVLTVSLLAAAALVSAFAAEPVLEFKVNKDAPRTAGMCGPTHDEEVIYGLGSDGKQHYFAVGTDVRGSGITIWQSEDMVNWKDVGRGFTQANKPAILENGGRGFAYTFRNVEIGDDGAYKLLDTPAQGNNRLGNAFWAPCIYYHVYDQTYYLYYCCSAFGVRNSFIGCAKSKTLDKGWTDCGVLIHTRVGDGKRFNAIDPAVILGNNTRRVWMVYGSYFGGISLIELDPKDPSKLLHPGTHGKTVASRTTDTVFDISTLEKAKAAPKNDPTAGQGVEGASILYHRYLFDGYYYLFVSYDNLEWSYHCRVGRSKDIEGPYLDYNGKPLIYDQRKLGEDTVYGTKIIGPYRWKSDNAGWAGTGHTTVFEMPTEGYIMFGSNSKWQGTPGSFLGLRRVFWTKDGWPLLSPCLYAGEDLKIGSGSNHVGNDLVPFDNEVKKESILNSGESAQWDFIVFSQSQDRSNRRVDESTIYTLKADGTIEGGGKWQIGFWNSHDIIHDCITDDGRMYGQSFLTNGVSMQVELPGGVKADGVCAYGWDQDRKCQTVFFTGLTDKGVAVWGQRIPPSSTKAN